MMDVAYSVFNYDKPFPNKDCVKANENEPYLCFFGSKL